MPNEVEIVSKGGFEGVADAVAWQQGGKAKAGKKVVIVLQGGE